MARKHARGYAMSVSMSLSLLLFLSLSVSVAESVSELLVPHAASCKCSRGFIRQLQCKQFSEDAMGKKAMQIACQLKENFVFTYSASQMGQAGRQHLPKQIVSKFLQK